MGINKRLNVCDEHLGQKVYQIEEEVSYVVKTQVIAKNQDEAFNKYLECSETKIARGIMAKIMVMILFLVQKNIQNIKEQH